MNHINKIIVIGTNHHNTLSMVRCFGEEGRKVNLYIYGDSHSYIASSIYVDSVSYYATASDAIVAIPLDSSNKPLVIACSDEVASLMDLQYDVLHKGCHFFNAGESGRITTFMDKQKQLKIARECGFSVPLSQKTYPNSINKTIVNYPCIVKPKESIHGGKHIAICKNKDELTTVLSQFEPTYEILVQDFIEREYEIVILGLSYEGKHYIPGYIKKKREFRGGTTYSTTNPIMGLKPNTIKSCESLINEIGYTGLWGIECIKQADKYYFIELNMRNDATTYALSKAGVNLPIYYYESCNKGGLYHLEDTVRTINAMVEYEDFNFVLKLKLPLFTWIREYRNSACKYFHSKIDPQPSKIKMKEYIRFLCNRILKM